MRKFLWHLSLAIVISTIVFFVIHFFITRYDYNGSLQSFWVVNKIYISIVFGAWVLIYMLQQYNEYKRINITQKSLFLIFLWWILFWSLYYLASINLHFSTIITAAFLISTILLFIKNNFLHFLSWLILISNVIFLAILLFPTYNKKVSLESILAHQHNLLIINNTENTKNNPDNIQVSCVFWKNSITFESSDFSKNNWYVLFPIENKIKCSSNTNLIMISWDNEIYNIWSWSFELEEKRNFEQINKSELTINNGKWIVNNSIQENISTGFLSPQEWQQYDDIYSFQELYQSELQKNTKNLFWWKFTDKENLEIIEYWKLLMLNDWLKEFLTYRVLIWKDMFWDTTRTKKELLWSNIKDSLAFLLEKKTPKEDFFETIWSKETIQEIKDWYNWLWKTRFLKNIGF